VTLIRTRVYKDLRFDAAHFLPNVPKGHKCGRLHGHTYRVRMWCEGVPNEQGWIVDYAEIAQAAAPLLDVLDHHLLNEVPGLQNPTTEILAAWILERMKAAIPEVCAIEVRESATTGCVVTCQN